MISYFKFAINNLKRNPIRCILAALSIFVSAATLTVVLSLDKGYTRAVQDDLVNKTGVHLYVTKEGCPIEVASVIAQGGLSPRYVEEHITDKVAEISHVEAVLPFKLFAITTDDGTRTDIFSGVTESIKEMRPNWEFEKGGWFENDKSVILGAEVALIEQLDIGDITYSEAFDQEFVVSGILKRNFSQDDGIFFLPLKTAQQLVNREGKLSAIAVKLNDISHLDAVKAQMRGMLPSEYNVVGSKELSEGILRFFGATRVIMFVMVLVAFVVSIFGVINTMLMSVLERKKELAYLKCVGAEKKDLIRIVFLETLMICTIGSAIGVIVGSLTSPLFSLFMSGFLIAFTPSQPVVGVYPAIMLFSFITCLVAGVLCAVYPSLRVASIVPMEVLRNE